MTPNQYDHLTPETANHMLFHLGEGGHPAGGFVTALMDLIGRADPANQERLRQGFPGYVVAYDVANVDDEGTGILALKTLAARGESYTESEARWLIDLFHATKRAAP